MEISETAYWAIIGIIIAVIIAIITLIQARKTDEKIDGVINEDSYKIDNHTGLLSKEQILEVINNQIQESQITNQPFVVILIDIDNFKQIYDSNHEVGDQIIGQMKSVFNIREKDYIFYCGGDEFLVVSHLGIDVEHGRQFAERLRENVEKWNFIIDKPKKMVLSGITICCGVTIYNANDTCKDLLEKAAIACESAKNTISEDGQKRKNSTYVIEILPKKEVIEIKNGGQ